MVGGFDGGARISDAGALLLGQTDRAIRLSERIAACLADTRAAELVEQRVETMAMQRVVGMTLGYEDLNHHDQLRHDPVLTVLASKLAAQRSDCSHPPESKQTADSAPPIPQRFPQWRRGWRLAGTRDISQYAALMVDRSESGRNDAQVATRQY